MDETIEIKVTSEMAGKRLDVVLSEQCSDLTRSYINKLCKEERAALNGKRCDHLTGSRTDRT